MAGKLTIDSEEKKIIVLTALGNRYYALAEDVDIAVYLASGEVIHYYFRAGFITNFRSGGKLVDGFIDQIGDQLHQAIWLIHDGNYTPCDHVLVVPSDYTKVVVAHPLCRVDADELLRAMLVFAGDNRGKASVIKFSVRVFAHSAYAKDDDLTPTNRTLFGVSITAIKEAA